MIRLENLCKSFGQFRALRGLTLQVDEGRILGLLGPNGAGKSTAVNVISTLLRPDSGTAVVAGHSVTDDPDAVRRSIGLSGQYAAVDEKMTGFENLCMVGRLYGMTRRTSANRARELLEEFRLIEVSDKRAGAYSGGMRRRLDLAGALVARPPVVILDEPTTGLDPQGRLDTWDVITTLVDEGTTVLLTTQYLEEADRLADRIAVIDSGHVIAEGTAAELKARVGGERLALTVEPAVLEKVLGVVRRTVGESAAPAADPAALQVTAAAPDGQRSLLRVLEAVDAAGLRVAEAALRHPTLDDVFLELTGQPPESTPPADDPAAEGATG